MVWDLTLKLRGGGQMALPLEILVFGSHKKDNVLLNIHVNLVYKKFDA